jgi:putative GTP pyrophosphokinase
VQDVYTVAELLTAQDDLHVIKVRDYIKTPNANGYRSLHLVVEVPVFLAEGRLMVPVEVQIRTIAMDFWAELEHQLRYKKDVVFTEEMAKELSECARISADLDTRMETLRRAVFATGK